MVQKYVYSPHFDFFIEKIERTRGYTMDNFHIHHKYEIYYEETGTRRYFIEDQSYTVNPGDVVLIGMDQIHKTESLGDTPSSRIVLNFSDAFLNEISSIFPETDFTSFLPNQEFHLLNTLTNEEQYFIGHILNDMVTFYASGELDLQVHCKLQLASLLLYLQRIAEKQKEKSSQPNTISNTLILEAQNYVVEHYAEDLTLNGIASALYVSPYHLSRLFRKHVGIGIIEYIKTIRIKVAQNMLIKTDDSITIISDKAGFSSAAHFRRVFKEITGMSPQKYRQYFKEK